MTKAPVKAPRRGGRPSREQAAMLEDTILDTATALFFDQGYGAVSIEQIAKQARISKRTFYARYDNKEALFTAVVHRVIHGLRPPASAIDTLFAGANIKEVLLRIAPIILHASMKPQAVALQRLMLAEARRFPEMVTIMHNESARSEAITRIAAVLKMQKSGIAPEFAAEQFLHMLTSAPQRRAMGLDTDMTKPELDQWAAQTVDLFLNGFAAPVK